MKRLIWIILASLVLLASCSKPDPNEKVATFKGEDIYAKDILSQYKLNDENIEIYLTEEILIQEAKELNLNVSDEEIEEGKKLYPPVVEDDPETEEFYKEQAAILDVEPQEYYVDWIVESLERNMMIQKYIDHKFGQPKDGEEQAWGREIEAHVDELFEEYQENGDLIIY